MSQRVVGGLLHDPKQSGFDGRLESDADVAARLNADARRLVELLADVAQRGLQADVVENRRPQLVRDPPNLSYRTIE